MLDGLEALDGVVVRGSVTVDLPPADAFRLFTDGINEWWPLEEGFSYGGDRAHEIFWSRRQAGDSTSASLTATSFRSE